MKPALLDDRLRRAYIFASPFVPTIPLVAAFFALIVSSFTLNTQAVAMNIQTVESEKGIKAWLVQDQSVPLVALRFAFAGGSSQDPDDKAGLTHFLSAMLDEGAGELKSLEFQEKMEEIAMRLSFDDSRDHFYGSMQSLSENLDDSVKLLKLALTEPRFDADAVDRIRKQLLANLAYAAKSPDRVASKEWFKQVFGDHPYGKPSRGTIESVKSITDQDLRGAIERTFARDNLSVVAVGDISPERLTALLDEVFGDLPEKSETIEVAEVSPPKGGAQQIVEMNVPQSVAMFGFGGLKRKDPDFMPAFVLNHIIGGGGFASKLMEEVREKRGLAYSVYSYLMPLDRSALYLGSVATKNEGIAESLDVIRAELTKMAIQGPTQEDLDNAKDYLTGSYALRFDSNSKIASQLLGIMVEDMGIDYVDTRNDMIEAVTLEDIKRVAKRFLDPDDLIVTIVGQPVGLEKAEAGPRG